MTQATIAPTAADLTGYAIVDYDDVMWGRGPTTADAWDDARAEAKKCGVILCETDLVALRCSAALLASGDGQDCRTVSIAPDGTLDARIHGRRTGLGDCLRVDGEAYARDLVAVTRAEAKAL